MMGEVKIKHKTQTLRATNKNTEMLLVDQDGEARAHTAVMRRIEVDEDKFAKLYISQLAAFWDLKKPAIKVLSYILSSIKPHNDKVLFNLKECMTYCGWTGRQAAYSGLVGLLNANIIARTEDFYFYYINPAIIFNGSRITLITQYTKKKKSEVIDMNQTKMSFQEAEQIFKNTPPE